MSTITAKPETPAKTLSAQQIDFFWEHGFLRLPQVYTLTELAELDEGGEDPHGRPIPPAQDTE